MIPEEVRDPNFGTIHFRETRELEDCLIIIPEMNGDEIDCFNISWLDKIVTDQIAGCKFVVFDYSRLKYVSDECFGLMAKIAGSVSYQLGELILIGMNSTVRELFETFGMSSFFIISDDVVHAVTLLSDPVEMKRRHGGTPDDSESPIFLPAGGGF